MESAVRPLLVVHLVLAQACGESDDTAPSGEPWAGDSASCDYLCQKRLRTEVFRSLKSGFNRVNRIRRIPECESSCDAVLTSVMGMIYARLCLTTFDAQQDQKWRVAPEREYFRFQCTGP